MTAINQDIGTSGKSGDVYFAGDDAIIEIPLVNDDGEPARVDGALLEWHVAKAVGGFPVDVPVIQKSTADGSITLVDPLQGGPAKIQIDSSDTVGCDGLYYHELQVTASDGKVYTATVGHWLIRPSLVGP